MHRHSVDLRVADNFSDTVVSSLEIAKIGAIANSPAVIRLSPRAKLLIANHVLRHPRFLDFLDVKESVINLFRDAYSEIDDDPNTKRIASAELCLLLIHEGRWEEAMRLIAPEDDSPLPVEDAFNLAMAHWGKTGTPSLEQMARAYNAISDEARLDANFQQCGAIAAWVVGDKDQAMMYLDAAVHLAKNRPDLIFSCWRYAYVYYSDFTDDCQSIRSMINGGNEIPLFLQLHRVNQPSHGKSTASAHK